MRGVKPPHAARGCVGGAERFNMAGVGRAKALRNQHFKRLVHDVLAAPAEHRFGRRAEKTDFLLRVHRDNGVRGRLKHAVQNSRLGCSVQGLVFKHLKKGEWCGPQTWDVGAAVPCQTS